MSEAPTASTASTATGDESADKQQSRISREEKGWEISGFSDALLDKICAWCVNADPGAFVLFSYGTVVYVTEAMMGAVAKDDTLPLPKIPTYRINGDLSDRWEYITNKLKTLKGRPLLLYRAAVRYLAEIGYPMPGADDSCSLIRLHDKSIWSSQYKNHARALTYMPKDTDISSERYVTAIMKDAGLRLDMMTLVPAYIHNSDKYDTINRALDPKIWDNPHQQDIYKDSETTGVRVYSLSPNLNNVLSAMIRGID